MTERERGAPDGATPHHGEGADEPTADPEATAGDEPGAGEEAPDADGPTEEEEPSSVSDVPAAAGGDEPTEVLDESPASEADLGPGPDADAPIAADADEVGGVGEAEPVVADEDSEPEGGTAAETEPLPIAAGLPADRATTRPAGRGVAAQAPTPSEIAVKIDDRISALFVIVVVATFAGILLYGMLLGAGGTFTPLKSPSPEPSLVAPSESPGASGSSGGSSSPGTSGSPAASSSPTPSGSPVASPSRSPGASPSGSPVPSHS
jgi:hypothetical protein